MLDEHTLTLRRADQARTDFCLIENNLKLVMGQFPELPMRAYIATAALGIMVGSAAIVILWAEAFWRL
jgi:hypothetical protein